MNPELELSSPHGTEYVKPSEQSSLINLVEKLVLHSPSIWPYSPSNETNNNVEYDDNDEYDDEFDDNDYDYDYFDNDDEFEDDDFDDCSSPFSSLIHDSLTDSSFNDKKFNTDNEDDLAISRSMEKKTVEDKKLIQLTNDICKNLNTIYRLPSSLKFERKISPFTHDLLKVRKRRQQIRKFGKVISEKSSPNNEIINSRAKRFLALLKKQLNSNVEQEIQTNAKDKSISSETSNSNSLNKPKTFNNKIFYNESDKFNKFYNEFKKIQIDKETKEDLAGGGYPDKKGICISKLRPHLLPAALQNYFNN